MREQGSVDLWWEILIIILSLVFGGLSSAIEKAVEEVKRESIKVLAADKDVRAERVLHLNIDRGSIYATTLIVHSFAILFISGVVMYNHLLPFSKFISDKLEKTFDITGVFFGFALGFIVIALAIGLLFLVFSVFYPRQVALQHPDSVALSLSLYGCATIKIFGPTATVVNFFTNIFLKLTRQKTGNYNKVFSQESVMSMIEVGQESGEIKEEGKKMISSIFDFDDKLAYEIMTPRTDVFMIDLDDETL